MEAEPFRRRGRERRAAKKVRKRKGLSGTRNGHTPAAQRRRARLFCGVDGIFRCATFVARRCGGGDGKA